MSDCITDSVLLAAAERCGQQFPRGIEAMVCKDIAARQVGGAIKYGTTVAENPLPLKSWLQHAYEECLDQAIYLKRAMEELK